MTTYTVADSQAQGLCWLARQSGLPPLDMLRRAVAQLHAEPCGWCDYPLAELMSMLRGYHPMARAERDWWAMPGRARLAAIRVAQGEEGEPVA